jgi:hypothetical protein
VISLAAIALKVKGFLSHKVLTHQNIKKEKRMKDVRIQFQKWAGVGKWKGTFPQ